MPTYRITAPDGSTYRVTAPDGASQDQVLAYAQQQWSAKPQAPAQPAQQAGPDDPGMLLSALIGAGRTSDQIVDGMKQMYLGAKSKFETPTMSDLVLGGTPSQRALKELEGSQAEKARLYKPLQDQHPIMTALGEAVPGMVVPVGGAASIAGNVGRLALAGAVPGALEYGSALERTGRAAGGAAAGVAGGVVVPKVASMVANAVPAVGRTVRAVAEPLTARGREAIAGRTLNRAAGDSAGEAAARLADAGAPAIGPFRPGMEKSIVGEIVPGSMPTAGQVAENGGIAALERSASAASPAQFTDRATEQAAARLRALRGVGGDDAAMASAVTARKSASGPLYDQAIKAVYQVDDRFANLLQRPDVKAALSRAEKLAANDGRQFQFTTTSSAPFAGVGGRQPEQSRQITGQALQDLKMAMDEMLSDPAAGFTGKAGDTLKSLRGNVLNWMEGANPVFKAARTTHADMSKPINQMQVGRHLEDVLTPALTDYGAIGKEAPAAFARALRADAKTAVKATDFRGAGALSDVLDPQALQSVTGIARDLARKSNGQELGRGTGSDTFQKMAMSNVAERSGAPGVVNAAMNFPGVNKLAKFMYSGPEEEIQTLIGQALLNPGRAGELMARPAAALQPQVNPRQLLLANPSRTTQVLGGLGGMATGNLFAQ